MSSLADRLRHLRDNVRREEWEMHGYQDLAVDFLWKNPFCALFIDTGLGKTVICLTLIAMLIMQERAKRILVIAPVRVAAQTWPNEIGEWGHTAWLEATVIRAEDDDPEVISAGKTAYDEARYWAADPKEAQRAAGKARTAKKEEIKLRKANNGGTIHIINREALQWLIDLHSVWIEKKVKGKIRRVRKIVSWPYDTVFIDESSSFKDHSTARFKALVSVRAQGFITRMHQLTATPAAEGYMGLFAQIFLLDLGARLGKNITAYRDQYFSYNKYNMTYKLIKGQDEVISNKIADICLVMKSKDYLDEEDPLFLPRRLRMSEFELAQYNKFERDFILTLADGEKIEAETAAALSAKLLQLASGAVYNKAGETRVVHDHKIDDLRELQEELGDEPLLVAYWYKSSLARLRKAFPDAAVMDKSGKIVKPWNDGAIKMLLVHPAGVGHGLNMQYGPGHDIYFFDLCWSYELYYQLYRRLHRQGQKLRCRVHLPQMIGTRDELVADRLLMKEDAQEALFNWIRTLRRIWKERKMAA